MRFVTFLLLILAPAQQSFAGEAEYRTGGAQYERTWQEFYVEANHEPEIDDPLIAKGKRMVPAICEAIRHKDMKRRRYAIGSLGYIGDRTALPILESILIDKTEIDYFRGDALHSIYQIDRKLGLRHAEKFGALSDTLGQYAKAVLKREPWLLEPCQNEA